MECPECQKKDQELKEMTEELKTANYWLTRREAKIRRLERTGDGLGMTLAIVGIFLIYSWIELCKLGSGSFLCFF